MDSATLWTAIGTVVAIIGIMYALLYNFKKDIEGKFDKRFDILEEKFDKRCDRIEEKFDKRCDRIEEKLSHMDRRISFFEGERYNEEKHLKVK